MNAVRLNARVSGRIAEKRLIFTVTTGRSGTGFLCSALKLIPDVTSEHEPFPHFGEVMRETQRDKSIAKKFLAERKLPEIARTESPVYIETSHLFCKGFLEPLLDLGITPDLIALERDLRAVATSLFEIGEIPGSSGWYLSPEDPGVLRLVDWRSYHEYQLCYWYAIEIARRKFVYKPLIEESGGTFIRIKLEDLTTVPGFAHLLRKMQLGELSDSGRAEFEQLRLRPVNPKTEVKARSARRKELESLDLEELEDEIHSVVDGSLRGYQERSGGIDPPRAAGWIGTAASAIESIRALARADRRVILIDDDKLPPEVYRTEGVRPLIYREGRSWGRPPNDRRAVEALQGQIRAGARFVVVAWTAFWWLDRYPSLDSELQSSFRCVRDDDTLKIFESVS